MKILNANQIREWDQYTIQHEPISSIDLMERAAGKIIEWLEENYLLQHSFIFFCGKGNNGGDGLAVARMLFRKKYEVKIFVLESGQPGTEDFQMNLERLQKLSGIKIQFIQSEKDFPSFHKNEIIIDALLGSGLNRPIEGLIAKMVSHINNSGCKIISIDVPSGLAVDKSSKGNTVVRAGHTLSFQTNKPAFLIAENSGFIGEVYILDISLHSNFYNSIETDLELIDEAMIKTIYKPRNRFLHKGNFGHALLVTGSYGKMGAAVLCAEACVRSGAGLTTCHIPKCGYEILQTAVPEAMVMTDFNSSFVTKIENDLSGFTSIGIGPGVGTASETKILLHEIFNLYRKPIVMDADALNILSSQKNLMKKIPSDSILTPHPKEFERLFGECSNDFERIELARQKAKEYNVIIVVKGHHTFIATPNGKIYFNNTGNAGMAKGGSGDVLTGILTALLAQKYNAREAATFGVWLHGLAGDIAAAETSEEAMKATDLINNLGKAFQKISGY
jgi:NAD(P)H-hydrate epimerase